MKKLTSLLAAALFMFAMIACSDSSSSPSEDYSNHPLNGVWNVMITSIDTKGISETTTGGPYEYTYKISGDKVVVTLKGSEPSQPLPFTSSGDNIQISGQNGYNGKMLGNDAFEYSINLSVPVLGKDRMEFRGTRKVAAK